MVKKTSDAISKTIGIGHGLCNPLFRTGFNKFLHAGFSILNAGQKTKLAEICPKLLTQYEKKEDAFF